MHLANNWLTCPMYVFMYLFTVISEHITVINAALMQQYQDRPFITWVHK